MKRRNRIVESLRFNVELVFDFFVFKQRLEGLFDMESPVVFIHTGNYLCAVWGVTNAPLFWAAPVNRVKNGPFTPRSCWTKALWPYQFGHSFRTTKYWTRRRRKSIILFLAMYWVPEHWIGLRRLFHGVLLAWRSRQLCLASVACWLFAAWMMRCMMPVASPQNTATKVIRLVKSLDLCREWFFM